MHPHISLGVVSQIATPLRLSILHHHALSRAPLTAADLASTLEAPLYEIGSEVGHLVELGLLTPIHEAGTTVINVAAVETLLHLLSPSASSQDHTDAQSQRSA